MKSKNSALRLAVGAEIPFGPTRATQSLNRSIALARRPSALAYNSLL